MRYVCWPLTCKVQMRYGSEFLSNFMSFLATFEIFWALCKTFKNIYELQGTTGFPKGATLTHHNIVNNARFMGFRMAYDKKVRIRTFVFAPGSSSLGEKGKQCLPWQTCLILIRRLKYNGHLKFGLVDYHLWQHIRIDIAFIKKSLFFFGCLIDISKVSRL